MAGNKPLAGSADLAPLLGTLRQLISDARSRALRAVDVIQVQTCWQVGHHIVEFEQGGAARAVYGKRLLPLLAGVRTIGAAVARALQQSTLRQRIKLPSDWVTRQAPCA